MDDSKGKRDLGTIEGLIRLLPDRFQSTLIELAHESRRGVEGEAELFGELRRCLNLCAVEGLLDRRAFLRIGSLIISAGLAHLIFPSASQAAGPAGAFAFWNKRSSSSAGYPANTGSDPYWDYVVLLMNMDTASGIPTTVFADDSNVGKTPTINGAAYIDTTASTSSPYSGRTGSAVFSGSTQYASYASSSDFQFTADLTIEFFVKFNSASGYQHMIASGSLTTGLSAGQAGWQVGISFSQSLLFFGCQDGGWLFQHNQTWAPSAGTWYHVAIVRASGTINSYVNGSMIGSSTSYSSTLTSNRPLNIGASSTSTPADFLNGALSDLRIYNGVAKYTGNFTPRTTPIGLGTANDKYWGYCVLACPFENTLKDMSGAKPTIAAGSPALTTTVKKFGSAAVQFDGSSSLLLADRDKYRFGVGDFTVEGWFRVSNLSGYKTFMGLRTSDGYTEWYVGLSNNALEANLPTTGYVHNYLSGGTVTGNVWHHFAFVRSGGDLYLYLNGTIVSSLTLNGSDAYTNANSQMRVGQQGASNYWMTGELDSLRITKGYARYTSNFTVPTASFPVGKDETVDPFWTYTVLEMQMDDFTDSTGRHTITNNGSVTSNTSTYKYGTASSSFNGTSQYLSLDTSSDWSFGTGDFTVEFWVRPTIVDTHRRWLTNTTAAFDANTFCIRQSGSGIYCICGTGDVTITNGVIANAWLHFVVVRKGSTVSVFCNGAMSGSFTSSSDLSKSQLFIGGYHSGAEYFQGYIDDLRITKGVARYTQSFIPPTRAFATSDALAGDPFWSQTVLLMNMDNLTDATGRQTVTNNGSVSNNTSTYKFGTASASFSGSGQYLSCPSNADFGFGTGDFTIEFWFYLNVVTGYQYLFDMRSGSDLYFYMDNGPNSSTPVGAPGSLSASTWYHFALCRSGGTARTYLNGTQMTSGANSSSYGTASFRIGASYLTSEYLNGYIDDLRITKGVARYTASFDSPSRALSSFAGAADVTSSIVTSGLVCYLDAGDGRSFAGGSAQKWRNMTTSPADGSSQNAYDFFLGASSSSESTDPTFVGVSGGRSANDYFSFDGGDYFTLAGGHTSFVNSLHKDGAKFTLVCVVRTPSSFGGSVYGARLFSTGTNYGFDLMWLKNTGKIRIAAYGSSFSKDSDVALSPSTTYFLAVSLDETASGYLYLNGRYAQVGGADTFSAAYSSPTTTDPDGTLRIGNAGVVHSEVYVENSTRIHLLQLYNRALSKSELDQNFAALRGRFGI